MHAFDVLRDASVALEWSSDGWMRSQVRRWIPKAKATIEGADAAHRVGRVRKRRAGSRGRSVSAGSCGRNGEETGSGLVFLETEPGDRDFDAAAAWMGTRGSVGSEGRINPMTIRLRNPDGGCQASVDFRENR